MIYYRENWLGTHPSESGLELMMVDSGQPFWAAIPNYSLNTQRNYLTAPFFVTTGSSLIYTGSDNQIAVPVRLAKFTGQKTGSGALLNWATASEINSSHFEIERSFDNKRFASIGTVRATGQKATYSYDDAFDQRQSSVVYYRLKIVDRDGSFEYSKTVVILLSQPKDKGSISVYPNPFVGDVFINTSTIDAGKSISITVVDITGKEILKQETISNGGSSKINMDNQLKPGVYFMSIETDGYSGNHKLIKQ